MTTRCLLALLLLLSTVGCVSGYAAPAPVAPLLTGRGDVVAGVGIRPGFPKREAGAYLAAAPSESSRIYVAGSHTNARWDTVGDDNGRALKEQNQTNQLEAGGGWGTATPHLRAEVLAGVGYGAVRSTQCGHRDFFDDYSNCPELVKALGHFTSESVQGQVAGHIKHYTGGGGLRVALVRFHYDEVLGHDGPVIGTIPTLEPFVVQRVELPFGSLTLMIHIPIVPYSPSVTLSGGPGVTDLMRSTRLIETPAPRFFLGFQANLDRLWRKRDGRNQ